MAITQTICTSYKVDLATGVHDFSTDTLKLALYTSAANLDADTTAFTTTGEVTGTGYTSGGQNVTGVTINSSIGTAYVDFADVAWLAATITARGALLYNSSKSNKAIAVLDFGSDKTSTNGTFSVVMPPNDALNALLRYA